MEPGKGPTKKSKRRKPPTVDTCWHLLPIAACVTFFSTATLELAGYLYIEFIGEYGADREASTWANSIAAIMGGSTGLLVTLLHYKFSVKCVMVAGTLLGTIGLLATGPAKTIQVVTFTFGVIHAVGSGTVFVSGILLTTAYFERLRGFALGFANLGMTLAGLIFPRLLKFLKETYGFSSSFYIWGALNLNLIPLILLFKVPPWYKPGNIKQTSAGIAHNSGKERGMVNNEENNQASSTFPKTLLSIARRPVFYLVEISSGINASVQFVVFTTMVDFAMDNGTADTIALWLTPSYLAVCSLGRILLPLVADKKLVPRSDLLTACYVVMGVTLLVLPLATNFWVIAALCSLTAAGYGCNYTLHDVLAIDYFGLERLLFMHGVMGLAKAPFQLCLPKLIGFFRDDGGSYDNVYRLQGGLLLFAALLWLPVACRERRNRIGKFTPNNHR